MESPCRVQSRSFTFLQYIYSNFSKSLLHGQVYRINDSVVIESYVASFDHSWIWKEKVKEFFGHEFQCLKQVFFQGKYYVTIPSSALVVIALEHELKRMRMVKEGCCLRMV